MAKRQGLTNLPFDSPKMDLGRIPIVADFIFENPSIRKSVKIRQNPNIQGLNVVINQMDPTRSLHSDQGSIDTRIFSKH